MANIKITELPNLAGADVAEADVFVVDDVNATESKKITVANLAIGVGAAGFTASRALTSDGFGDIAVSDVTSTELGYLDGVSSAVQTQIDAKIATTASASNDFVTFARLDANVNVVSANSQSVEARRAANNTILTAEDTALQARIAANTLVAASNDFVTFTRLNANLNTTTANVTAVESRRAANNTLLTNEDTALQARIAANTLVAASNDFVTYYS